MTRREVAEIKPPLGRLATVRVPWRLNASSSIERFVGSEGHVALEAVAYFGRHAAEREEAQIRAEGREPTDAEFNRLGQHRIEIRFPMISAFRVMPPRAEGCLIDEAAYDWSEFPQRDRAELAKRWAEEGICPDPRFFRVLASSWIQELGLKDQRHRHWLLLGHDACFEVISSDFEWELADRGKLGVGDA